MHRVNWEGDVMKDSYRLLAFDLGAESGRAVLGILEKGRIE